MKKKLLTLLVAFIMMLSMAGCNAEGLELIDQMKKVAAWDATNMKGTINLELSLMGETVKVEGDYTAYTSSKDLQMEMAMNIKSIEAGGSKIDLTKGQFKLSPIKCYMDGMKFYISTSYVKELAGMVGVDPNTIMDVSKDYIALDMNSIMDQMGMTKDEIQKMNDANFDLYKNSKVNLPVVKKDNSYSIELKDSEIVDVFFDFVIEVMDSQKDMLTAEYKAMGMTDAQIQEAFAQINAVYGPETKALVKPYIKGSTAKINYTFADDKYTAGVSTDIKVAYEGQTMAFNMVQNLEVSKTAVKTINFPTSVKVYTMEDIMKDAMGQMSSVRAAKKECIVKGGKTYVPAKKTLQQVGLTVGYDKKTKTNFIKELNNMTIHTIVKNGVSYISVEELENLGIKCVVE